MNFDLAAQASGDEFDGTGEHGETGGADLPKEISEADFGVILEAVATGWRIEETRPSELLIAPSLKAARAALGAWRTAVLADTCELSLRLLLLALGTERVGSVMIEYATNTLPSPSACVEAARFGRYLERLSGEVPSLGAALRFERALLSPLMDRAFPPAAFSIPA